MLQLLGEVFRHSDTDATELSLLYANKTEGDILLRQELDKLREEHPGRFNLWYTVSKSESTGELKKNHSLYQNRDRDFA